MHELQMWVNHHTRLPLAFLFSYFLLESAFSPSWSSIRTLPVCPIPPQAPRFPDARVLISVNVSFTTSRGKTNEQEVNPPNKQACLL